MFRAGLIGAMAMTLAASGAFAADPAPPPMAGGAILTWTPEQQLYGYRNMEKVTPVGTAPRGPTVRALPPGRTIDPKWTWDGKDQTVDGYMAAMRTSAVVVLKDGKVVLEKYGMDRRPEERWTSFSVAKSMTATLVGAAIKDGRIESLDEVVTRYIPELKGSAYEGVTVRQLLTMTSGVKWNEDYTDRNSDVARAGFAAAEPGMNPIVSYMRRLPREAQPGTKFVYKTGETDLAGILVSKAVGKSLSAYLSEKIWAPYGFEQDAIWVLDSAGHERGGCCMSMTARDYARIGQFMLDGGTIDGTPVLPDGWVADATTAHQTFAPGGVETGYGYFWWIIEDGYAAEGIFGQQVFVYPADRLVIAVNSAWPAASKDELWAAQAAFAKAVRAAAR